MDDHQHEITRILDEMPTGDGAATARLLDLAYSELRAIASSYFREQRRDHTLQPTALVHEAFVKLTSRDGLQIENRNHFFALCALAMRSILTDHARRHHAEKRGGDWQRVSLTHAGFAPGVDVVDLLELDDALTKLASMSPHQARLIEYRFFADMEVADIAVVVDRPIRSVQNDLRMARAWLKLELEKSSQ